MVVVGGVGMRVVACLMHRARRGAVTLAMPILPCFLLFLFLVSFLLRFHFFQLFLLLPSTAVASSTAVPAASRRDGRPPLLLLRHPKQATVQAFLLPQRPQHSQQPGERTFVALLHLPG